VNFWFETKRWFFMWGILTVIIIVILYLISGIRVLIEYERAVIFRLGRYQRVIGPGLVYFIPIIESIQKIDMRIKTADIPRQEIITKDNIPILANTVVYFKVEKPADAIIKIEDFEYAVKQYTQAALRDVAGNYELDFVLSEREKIAGSIKEIVDAETSGWGVDIESIKIQEIELPAEMKRAMAKQAEAERERRAVIISSEGELKASENLRKAAETLSKSPIAIQLRTLQTIRDIAADPSEKIVLFLPSDIAQVVKKVSK
jgi:regulator of protease activity HflC (stomatin/prohibitin superfamily)